MAVTPRRVGAHTFSLTLHLAAIAVAVWSAGRTPTPTQPRRARTVAVFAVPRDDNSGPPGLRPIDPADIFERRIPATAEVVNLPTFAMNVAKITSRAAVLFPFVTPGLALHRFAIESEREMRETFHDPFAPAPASSAAGAGRKPPLAMSASALQRVIDRAWSRRDRWTPFREIAALADSHDPDTGQLAALLHSYRQQDGLQPYVDPSIRDPRLWAELGLAADHVEFIAFISGFASAHPGTKATTELLFLLDELAQANMDALMTLLDTDPAATLRWTRDVNRDAYDLIVDLRDQYARQLRRRGLTAAADIAAHYANVRLDILTGLLRSTPNGYRASDARFLIGRIHWDEGRMGDALRAWRPMRIEPSDAYAASIARILDAIESETGGDRASVDSRETTRRLALQINSILRAEHGRWIMASVDRLQRFGFHVDTY